MIFHTYDESPLKNKPAKQLWHELFQPMNQNRLIQFSYAIKLKASSLFSALDPKAGRLTSNLLMQEEHFKQVVHIQKKSTTINRQLVFYNQASRM